MAMLKLPEPALLFNDATLRWLICAALLMLVNRLEPKAPFMSMPEAWTLFIWSATTRATRPSSFMAGSSTVLR
ncbi:hypothetical protein D3C76_1440390 [compost metagenome]